MAGEGGAFREPDEGWEVTRQIEVVHLDEDNERRWF